MGRFARTTADIAKGKNIDDQVDATLDRLLVEFGKEILSIVPGKVSTEVDARFSFDKDASLEKARHIIDVRRLFPQHQSSANFLSSTSRSASGKSAF